MEYIMNMDDEKPTTRKRLLPEGWSKFRINSIQDKVSKSGNEMIIVNITHLKTSYSEDIFLVTVPKKRWLLKKLLESVGITRSDDGNYKWTKDELIGKEFAGLVEHEDNEYINREGVTVKAKQHRINDFDSVDNQIQWDEN